MRPIHVEPAANVGEVGVADRLALAVSDNPQRGHQTVQRNRDNPAAKLLVAMANHRPVGVAGYIVGDS